MASIFGILNRKKKLDEGESSPEANPESRISLYRESNEEEKELKKDMTDEERALKVPNQNNDLNSAAPLPDISKLADKIGSTSVQMKTYDIEVYEIGDNGTPTRKTVNGVKATSAQELIMLYGADGARIKILREYGDNASQNPIVSPQQNGLSPTQQFQPQFSQQQFQQKPKEPPKFFEIGGVKCKLEDGKMFQEQWVRVDSTKYRLISDSTNKVVPMSNKHLETLKWVQIEDGETENGQN